MHKARRGTLDKAAQAALGTLVHGGQLHRGMARGLMSGRRGFNLSHIQGTEGHTAKAGWGL